MGPARLIQPITPSHAVSFDKRCLTHSPFQRFPTWMWRNTDVAAFIDWMREHNTRMPQLKDRAGFYGLDL